MTGRRLKPAVLFLLLAVVLIAFGWLSLRTGSTALSRGEVLTALRGSDPTSMAATIIRQIRLPRLLLAAILGGALALSGYLLQTYFGNPLAGPFVLGISSGAKLAVAEAIVFWTQGLRRASSWTLIVAAFAGALAATGFILLLGTRMRSMASLLVGGIMVGYICQAGTDLIVTFAADSDIVNLRNWSLGSFSGANWDAVRLAFVIVLVCACASFALAKPAAAFLLGEDYARSVGVPIAAFRALLILLSSLLSACVTAFAGPISFVGIAIPHVMRSLFSSEQPQLLMPACLLGGAAFCVGCDWLARMAFAPTELNVSTVTAIFGAPIVISMMIRAQKRERP